ncbi:MFS transporter [Sphingobium sp. CFD-2]|uniref:MFS transporter n=1 Tax=Sphingobium sp. CFD-2 TaxID=2878542 RepID=UPI00214A8ECB|nr:MFS transporter [Sphingobium sp. CFD-2]
MQLAPTAVRQPAPGWTLAGLSLMMLMPSLSSSTANVALPSLARRFAASFQATQWIILAYLLTVTALVVLAGHLGDIFGRRRLLLAGIVVFATGSLLCAMAPGLELLIAGRVIQGSGAAFMMALTMAFVGTVVPAKRTGRAMGLLGTMSAIGTTLGPALGGGLIAWAGSTAIFLINLPLAAVAAISVLKALPQDPPRGAAMSPRLDMTGMALLAATLTSLTLAMTLGRGQFGFVNLAVLAAAIGTGAVFLAIEARAASPLIRLDLLRNRALVAGLSTSIIVSTVMMTTLIVGPFYLARVVALDPAGTGLAMATGPFVAAIAGVPAGRLVERIGVRSAVIAGLAAMAAGATALSIILPAFGIAGYLAPIVVMTAGYGLFQAANSTAVMAGTTPGERGIVSGMLNLSRNLGLVVGASAMGAVFAWGIGSADIISAEPVAVATGTRASFAAAAILVVLSLVIARRATRANGQPALVRLPVGHDRGQRKRSC